MMLLIILVTNTFTDKVLANSEGKTSITLREETVLAGKNHKVQISNNASNVNTNEPLYFRIDMELKENVSLVTNFGKDGTLVVTDTQNGNKKILLHLEKDAEGKSYIWYTLEPGETVSFELEFNAKNGISGEETNALISVGRGESEAAVKEGNLIENTVVTKECKWTAQFDWNAIDKSVSPTSNLKITSDNKLSGDLEYKIEVNKNKVTEDGAGTVWTEKIVIEDSLVLPEGVTLPTNHYVSGNKVLAEDGTVIYEIKGLPEGASPLITTSEGRIDFTVEIKNDTPITKDLSNINFGVVLGAKKLEVASDYNPGDGENQIKNSSTFYADAYNSELTSESQDQVVTTIEDRKAELSLDKQSSSTKVSAGEEITYTITLKNTGSLVATGKESEIMDTLPQALTLTEEQKKAIESLGGKVDEKEGRFTITFFDWSIDPGEVLEFTFSTTVRSAEEIAELGNLTYITNTAKVEQNTSSNTVEYERPNLGLQKTTPENGDTYKDGDKVPYTVKVSNDGTTTINNIVATDLLPKGYN